MTTPAVDQYNRLLEQSPSLLEESRQYLLERFREVNLVFGGRTLCPYLRPHFVTQDEWRLITGACETLWGAIQKVAEAATASDELQNHLGVTDAERDLISIDPGYPDVSASSRLDSFLSGDSYQFVELNAECPAGIAYHDVAAEIFLDLPVMRAFRRTHTVTAMYSRDRMLGALLDIYSRVSGTDKKPNIAIVDYDDVPTRREFELFKEYFESNGYNTTVADPRRLELRQGALHHDEFRIDVVYRRVLTTELIDRIDQCKPFVDACRSRAVVVVNSFRAKLVHKKMLFGILTDGRFSHLFNDAERRVIARHVPWTRRMQEGATTHDDVLIDLFEWVRLNRDRLVLKPNDDYGGHGIYIGWESDESDWDSAISNALKGDYLVQERVTTAREIFPWVDEAGGDVRMVEQLCDLDPLLFFGRVAGAFTRLSSSSLANVTSGAGMVPTMITS